MNAFLANKVQNIAGSNDGQQMTQPPEKMGLKTCRTIPPTWNKGMRLQLTSVGRRFQLSAMVAAAVSMSLMTWGTSFLFPVVPDVNKTSTSSLAPLGATERALSSRKIRWGILI